MIAIATSSRMIRCLLSGECEEAKLLVADKLSERAVMGTL
jgi:hypothetical protein